MYGQVPSERDYSEVITSAEAGNLTIGDMVRRGDPFVVSRLGTYELYCISYFTRWRSLRGLKLPYPQWLRGRLSNNAGVFSTDDAELNRFAAAFLAAVSAVDVMAVWFWWTDERRRNEPRILKCYCPDARLIHPLGLEPWLYAQPWTAELADKVVLVVHPFARSIESQFREHRQDLFSNPRVLPSFELKTLKAVQSVAGHSAGFRTWSDALSHMCDQIGREEFDIAIIGAGAYGPPLAAFVKSQGKQAVHIGGATQLLFGIKGRRWEVDPTCSRVAMFNENWVRPLPGETPERAEMVEEGCYW